MEKFTKNLSNEIHKREIDKIVALTISSNHKQFHEKNRLLTEHSNNEILKIVNNNIKTLIMNNQSTKLNPINHINFPKLAKTLKNFFDESRTQNADKIDVSNEDGIFEIKNDIDGNIISKKAINQKNTNTVSLSY